MIAHVKKSKEIELESTPILISLELSKKEVFYMTSWIAVEFNFFVALLVFICWKQEVDPWKTNPFKFSLEKLGFFYVDEKWCSFNKWIKFFYFIYLWNFWGEPGEKKIFIRNLAIRPYQIGKKFCGRIWAKICQRGLREENKSGL